MTFNNVALLIAVIIMHTFGEPSAHPISRINACIFLQPTPWKNWAQATEWPGYTDKLSMKIAKVLNE